MSRSRWIQLVLVMILSLYGQSICMSNAQAADENYQQRIRQVELYIEGMLYTQAIKELKQLEKTPEGAQDVRVSYSLALAYYNSDDINNALFYLRKAKSQTVDEGFKTQLTQTYQQWIKSYGLVQFKSGNDVRSGSIQLTAERNIVNPKRRKSFKTAQKQLADGITTPISFYLPFGSYQANSVSFQLRSNLPPPVVELMLTPIKVEPLSTKSSKWVYITLGGVALIATAIGGYYLMTDSPSSNLSMVKLD